MHDRLCIRLWIVAAVLLTAILWPTGAMAQWNPQQGEWGKDDSLYLRVMTWNVQDGICSSNSKQEGYNNWHALVVIVASLQPDVLIIQEGGDNNGNGTGSYVDNTSQLTNTMNLFFNGGIDPYNGNVQVTSYVQKYAPGYTLPYVYASSNTDGFNRDVIASRYPFKDLNGDTKTLASDSPNISSDLYAPGGDGGIRGFQMAEIDLPDLDYSGDVVIGNQHLKAGSDSGDKQQRLEAAQNVAYLIDYWFNGADAGTPDPRNKIGDNPPATAILDSNTPVIWGGDLNEDENTNGRDGPALWMTRAQYPGASQSDGTDRDRSDSFYDGALDPITGDRSTRLSYSNKYDYLCWQDSIAIGQNAFNFDSRSLNSTQRPPELSNFGNPYSTSTYASDHKPVVVDFELPQPSGGFSLIVNPSPLIAGVFGAFYVTNGLPNEDTYLAYSVSGTGSTYVPFLNVTLGIRNPKAGAGPDKTDAQGVVDWLVKIPSSAAGINVWFQAVQAGQASNVFATSVN